MSDDKMTEKFEVRITTSMLERVVALAKQNGIPPTGKDFADFKRNMVEGGIQFLENFVDKEN